MKEIMEQIMAIVTPAIITTIGIFITWGLNEARKFVKSKSDNDAVDLAFKQFNKIVNGTVIKAEQVIKTFGDDGKITKEEAEKIKRIVLYDIKKQLPDSTGVLLKKAVNDLDSLIDTKIEEEVYKIKQNKSKICLEDIKK